MDTLSIIVTLVSVIGEILQIILFFKVWGMCNDIKAMREVQAPAPPDNKDSKVTNEGCGMLILAFILVALIIGFIIYNN